MSDEREMATGQELDGKITSAEEENKHTATENTAADAAKKENEARDREQAERDAREKAERDRRDAETARRDAESRRRNQPEQQKGLFARLREFVIRAYHRAKHAVERAIGRGRILAQPYISRISFQRSAMGQTVKADPSVDRDKATQSKTNDKDKGRNWGDLLYHGFARRILGKDAYMHAVNLAEKQEPAGPTKTAQEPDKPSREQQPGTAGKTDNAAKTAGEEAHEKNADKKKPQPTQEEMKGKIDSLHKIITNTLEDKYSNAKEAKETYLAAYTQRLQGKLTEINDGQPVQVSASRENGQLTIRINDQKDQFGNYPSFMKASMIKIEIDNHLNVVSAEGKILTERTSNGNFKGTNIDLTNTLGKYVVSDLAIDFREKYNTVGGQGFNITSRNEFDKTMREAAARNADSFKIDNIMYTISVKDNHIQVQTTGDKTFNIAMNGGPEALEQAKQNFEAKNAALLKAQTKMSEADKVFNAAKNELVQKQADYNKAETKANAAVQAHCDIGDALKETGNQLAARSYPGRERMHELQQRQQELINDNKKASQQEKNAITNKNIAQAALDAATKDVTEARTTLDNLKTEVTKLQRECEEAKAQIETASQTRNSEFEDLYKAHRESAEADRKLTTQTFEKVLPECRDSYGDRLGLNELCDAMRDGRTDMAEVLKEYMPDGRENEEPSIGQEPDRDYRQNDARDASEERE